MIIIIVLEKLVGRNIWLGIYSCIFIFLYGNNEIFLYFNVGESVLYVVYYMFLNYIICDYM